MKVVFVFTNGIDRQLALKLKELGVIVEGEVLDNVGSVEQEQTKTHYKSEVLPAIHNNINASELSTEHVDHITKINLDVSAMLAYVSSVTNGSCQLYEFSVPVLKQQAIWERERPQKPILDNFFKGRYIYNFY